MTSESTESKPIFLDKLPAIELCGRVSRRKSLNKNALSSFPLLTCGRKEIKKEDVYFLVPREGSVVQFGSFLVWQQQELTLSLLKVISVKFPLQPQQKYCIIQYEELSFS